MRISILSNSNERAVRRALLAGALALTTAPATAALPADAPPGDEDVTTLDLVNIVGVSPVAGTDIAAMKLPYNVQSIDDSALARAQTLDLGDFMNRHLAGVSANATQGNPLQPDLQFRGFTATPLLGGSEGMSVYLDGVRVNEVFGDTVNWDLIPQDAIERMSLLAGANPVFGLNTLGGAISIQSKTGFSDPGTRLDFHGGSFGRTDATFETAGNAGAWGWYLMGNRFDEDGWRDQSPSNAKNSYATLSWRGDAASLDVHLGRADTDLTGNGAAPVEELAQRWRGIFTAPDETANTMNLVSGQGSVNLADSTRLSLTLFHRAVKTHSYNGDGSDFEACDADAGILCDDGGAPILDQDGHPIPSVYDAINNISERRQTSDGGTVQLSFDPPVAGRQNQLVVGVDVSNGRLDYDSAVEAAVLEDNRHTSSNSGLFIADEALALKSRTRSSGVYLTDTLSISDAFALTLSGRSNHTRTRIEDPTGANPDLAGRHGFSRFNPAVGVTWQWTPAVNFYGGYSESTRAPTPVELTCADENAPCKLPNQFLSDPSLKQVVARGWEGGLRGGVGSGGHRVDWHFGLFRTTNADDILFQSTGGTQSNEGFFANVGDTRRQGIEAGVSGASWDKRLDWYANYTYLDATYLASFSENSANHPDANADGLIFVGKGDRIPGLPKHSMKLGADFAMTRALNIGGDVVANSGQFLRGDEANLLDETAGYALLNLRASYAFNAHASVFARVDNVFDRRYVSFGTLGKPGGVLPEFSNPRFFGPGQPRAAWIGMRLAL
jgi:outer membrane receptor protein involved in Fe transport